MTNKFKNKKIKQDGVEVPKKNEPRKGLPGQFIEIGKIKNKGLYNSIP